jgi:PmbA protein
MGYAFTEMFDEGAERFLLEKARESCDVLETKEPETLFEGEKEYPVADNFSSSLDQKDFDYLSKTALALEDAILKYDSRIIAVDDLFLSYDVGAQAIRNTLGLNCTSTSNMLSIYANSRCVAEGQTKTGYCIWTGRDTEQLDIAALSKEAAEDSLEKLGAAPIRSGKYSVILDARAAADLLSAYNGIFSAESVQKGFSLLAGKLGERIASDRIELRDDGVLPASLFSYSFDSEGVAARNKKLIENGTLLTFLHNRKTAATDGVDSTGNGFRSGYKSSIDIAPTNLYFAPGIESKDALFKKLNSGLFIQYLTGLHAGVNEISGDFSLSCEGFLVVDGKKGRPVDQITVSGNFIKLLQSVIAVADDLYFNPPSESGIIGSPSLLIEGLTISGE